MKKISSILLSFVLVGCFGLSVLANGQQSAVITATVPSDHTVTVYNNDNGDVLIVGKSVIPNNTILTIARGVEQEYIFRPKSGYQIESVTYNGQDITAEIEGGRWLAPKLTQDSILTAAYGNYTPQSGNHTSFTIVGQITLNGKPLAKTTLNLTCESGTFSVVTDENGKYRLNNITAGFHSLTVTSAGIPVGYVEFNVSEANIGNVKVDESDNGSYEITVNGSMKYFEFNFSVQNSGNISLSAQSISIDKLTDFPNTGDQSMTMLIFLILTALILAIFVVSLKRKANVFI